MPAGRQEVRNDKQMKPKKSLGQNFLKDKSVLEKIIFAANLSSDDIVLEVGPGQGILTEELAKYAKKVIAIEIDKNLADILDSRLRGNDKVEIINDDILKINLPEIIKKNNFQKYKVIANIPYYITSPIIQLFLETKYPSAEMILMVQREVAERIVAKPGDMSILAVSVQYYADAELLFSVDKKAFWPIPEVDSAIIKIIPKRKHEQDIDKQFFRIVRAGFSSKRKTLLNNLSSSFHLSKKETEEKIKRAGLDPTQRAQELDIKDWKKLAQEFI